MRDRNDEAERMIPNGGIDYSLYDMRYDCVEGFTEILRLEYMSNFTDESLDKLERNPRFKSKIDKTLEELDKRFEPWLERLRASERLTEKDYNLIVY